MAGTVTVGCKLPNGLELRVMEAFELSESVPGGIYKTVERHRQTGETVFIKGTAVQYGMPVMTQFGYALTTGVDSDFWEAWLKQNGLSPLVKNNQVYALPREDSAKAKAKELEATRTGLEPIDPNEKKKVGPGSGLVVEKADLKAA